MRFFWDVLLPLSKTTMAALFVIQFIYGWNQYLWPLLITTEKSMTPIVLGVTQISVSFSVNLLIALSAAGIAGWFARNPFWLATQRYVMGGVLAALAVKLAFEPRRG